MKRSQKHNRHYFCSEPLEQIENFKAAEAENFAGWCLHHRLEIQPDGTRMSVQELKDKDLYFHRPASELVFMRNGEHRMLHNIGNTYMKGHKHSEESRHKNSLAHRGKHHSAETCQKISEAMKGENNPFFGKHHSEESRKKIAEALKGKSNSTKGKLWWNDGISNKRSKECPGPAWKRGCLKRTGQA